MRHSSPLHLIERSKIILLSSDGFGSRNIANQCRLNRHQIQLWCNRSIKAATEIDETEHQNPQALKKVIRATLSDEHRSERPRYFSEDQIAEILRIACQSPEDKELPFSHWTPQALARQVEKENIVESISTRSVSRFLKRSGFKDSSSSSLAESQNR